MATAKATYRLWLDQRAQTFKMRKRYKGREYNFDCETVNKRLAVQRADKELARLVATSFGETPQKTIHNAVERYLKSSGHLKPGTAKRYGNALFHVLERFGAKPLDALSLDDLDTYAHERRQDVSPVTIGFELKMLATVMDMCRVWDWCKGNVARDYLLRLGKTRSDLMKRNRRTRYLSHEEEERLLTFALARRPAYAWRIVFAIETGLRKAEQFALEIGDINFQSQRITVRPELPGNKSGRGRVVPLTKRAIDAARRMHVSGTKYVCPKEDGGAFAHGSAKPWEALTKLAEGAGVKGLRWHDLRRTCGCRLLQDRGFRKEDVQLWLGHASITETEQSYAFLEIDNVHARLRASTPGVMIEHRSKDDD